MDQERKSDEGSGIYQEISEHLDKYLRFFKTNDLNRLEFKVPVGLVIRLKEDNSQETYSRVDVVTEDDKLRVVIDDMLCIIQNTELTGFRIFFELKMPPPTLTKHKKLDGFDYHLKKGDLVIVRKFLSGTDESVIKLMLEDMVRECNKLYFLNCKKAEEMNLLS